MSTMTVSMSAYNFVSLYRFCGYPKFDRTPHGAQCIPVYEGDGPMTTTAPAWLNLDAFKIPEAAVANLRRTIRHHVSS